jgi:hypothetical protein
MRGKLFSGMIKIEKGFFPICNRLMVGGIGSEPSFREVQAEGHGGAVIEKIIGTDSEGLAVVKC